MPSTYDAEYHLGLVADDPSAASENVSRFNDACEAMWHNGSYPFEGGLAPGPILKPIQFSAKEFFFDDTLIGSRRLGSRIFGSGGRSYGLPAEFYTNSDGYGGAITRFTRTTGETGTSMMRVRGSGMAIENISFRGRVFSSGSGAPDDPGSLPTGQTNTSICLEIEPYPSPSSSAYMIRDCSFDDFDIGICCRRFYYNGDGSTTDREDNADTSYVSGCIFNRCGTVFRSENVNSMCWRFSDTSLNGLDMLVLDVDRGGMYVMDGLWCQIYRDLTLLKVAEYSQNNAYITINNFRWDHLVLDPLGKFCAFKYAGPTDAVWFRHWTVRIQGLLGNPFSGMWDMSKVIDMPATDDAFPYEDILLDIRASMTIGPAL